MVRVLHVLHREIATSRVRHVHRLVSAMNRRDPVHSISSLARCEQEQARLRAVLASHPTSEIAFCAQAHALDAAFLPRFSHQLGRSKPDVVHYWGSERNLLLQIANRIFDNRPLVTTLDDESCVVGVSIDQIKSQPAQPLRDHLGLAKDAKLIAVRSDLKPQNRGKDLIWALDCLRVLHHDVFLVFFGDGNYQSQLKEFSDDANADDGVVFFVSSLERNSDRWFSECDLLWNADPVGNLVSIVEAMNCGMPVVAADTVAGRTAVVDRESGFLVPVGDAAEFARRTNILLNDNSLYAEIGTAARQNLTTKFCFESMVEHYEGMYEEFWQRRSAHAA